MKILIVTWMKYNNYGTVLQSYALQKKIQNLGYDVKTLDDHSVGFDLMDKEEKNKFKIFLKFIYILIRYPFNGKARRKYKKLYNENLNKVNVFDKFKNDFMNIEYDAMDKRYLNNQYQIFITGSDQIWSPLPTIFSKHYYLDFVENYNSKISYAPSMGQSNCSKEMKEIIKTLLKDFENISVREEQGKKILEQMTDKKITVVLDPTLLLKKEEWNLVCSENIIKEKYIFCYFLSDNDWYQDYVKLISEKYKIKVIKLTNTDLIINNENKPNNIGPDKFLALIKYADYVITDSFHGTIFSLIFEKKFVCLKRFEDTDKANNQNSRLYNLFNIINLKERFIDKENQVDHFDKKIKYEDVNSLLLKKIEESEKYLVSSIENAKGNRIITSNCTGCMACYNVCPVNAIVFQKDNYGEYKPHIDLKKCIKCGKCKEICPSNKIIQLNQVKTCYAAISNNSIETQPSSSGGIAYEIGKYFINNNGIVYGCIMDDNLTTKYVRINNIEFLKKTQGSKYSQSIVGNTYKSIKNDLTNNINVLFVGNPCQVAGLKSFLKKEYSNLLTIDLVCHGNVPTDYIKEYSKRINKKVNRIIFRNKRCYCLQLYDKNKLVYKNNNDPYLYAFLKDVSLRESCYHCPYAKSSRGGDITLGDFWTLKSEKAYSILTINTNKGKNLIEKIDSIDLIEKNYNDSIQGNDSFNHPQGKSDLRLAFNSGVLNGFNCGMKCAKLKQRIKYDNYPIWLKKLITKISKKIYKIKKGVM